MKMTYCLIVALLAASPATFAQTPGNNPNAGNGTINRDTPSTPNRFGAGGSEANAPGYPTQTREPMEPGQNSAVQNGDQRLNPKYNFAPSVATALTPDIVERDIHNTAFNQRGQLLDEINQKLAASKKLINSLKHSSKANSSEVHTQFTSALNGVKAKERILARDLKQAHQATPDSWNAAQETLSADYQDYAASIAELNSYVQQQ